MHFTSSLKVFEIIENLEIWAWCYYCYWYVLSLMSSYYWCQWCNYASTTKWIQKTFKYLLKTYEWYHILIYGRNIETPWNSLFDDNDKSILYRFIQEVECQFACNKHKIDILDNSNANLNARDFFDNCAFQDIFIHDVKSVFIWYIHILKLPLTSDNLSIQNIHEQNYMDSAILWYSCPFEEQCFSFSSLK